MERLPRRAIWMWSRTVEVLFYPVFTTTERMPIRRLWRIPASRLPGCRNGESLPLPGSAVSIYSVSPPTVVHYQSRGHSIWFTFYHVIVETMLPGIFQVSRRYAVGFGLVGNLLCPATAHGTDWRSPLRVRGFSRIVIHKILEEHFQILKFSFLSRWLSVPLEPEHLWAILTFSSSVYPGTSISSILSSGGSGMVSAVLAVSELPWKDQTVSPESGL